MLSMLGNKFSGRHFEMFFFLLLFLLFVLRKYVLTFHANCLQWKNFAWNFKSCFLKKKKEKKRRKKEEIYHITKTYLYNFDPLKPHFYIVKLGFTGVYINFFIFAQNIDCGFSLEPPHRGGSNEYLQSMFWAKIWKIPDFFNMKIFIFWVVKFSMYLNRRVFVMQVLLSGKKKKKKKKEEIYHLFDICWINQEIGKG